MRETTTPREHLARGHDYGEPVHARERQRMLAAMFRPDERCERLLQLRATDPAAFRALGPTATLTVGHYDEQRAAHQAERKEGAAS